MQQLDRLYFLACELHPTLPDYKLMRLLPKIITDLLVSATKSGISSGLANFEQLASFYEQGAKIGVDATDIEFKSLLTSVIYAEIEKKTDISIDDRMHLVDRLVRYYKQGTSLSPQVWRKFNDKAPPMAIFPTNFEPLDRILINPVLGNGACTDVMTIIAHTGTGKSYLSMAIAASWQHGSVLLFDPENGEGLVMTRANQMSDDPTFDNKDFIFGHYDVDEILEYIKDNPDPGRLVIMDSLHCVCGDGRTPDSGARYERAYKIAVIMKRYAKLIIITTQVKRGADGDGIEAGAASSNIERYSGVQIHLEKKDELEDGNQEYRLFCSKNRNGVGGKEIKFAFDYGKAKCRYIIEPPKRKPIEEMEYFQ